MDPGSLALLIPITALVSATAIKITKVIAQSRSPGQDLQLHDRLAALEDEVTSLRGELGEAHERLDFAERLLAQHRPEKLPGPE